MRVLDNLSVTGLDFHTVPDGVAPHRHRHPHWVPHPSRWSVELLLVAFPPSLGMPFTSFAVVDASFIHQWRKWLSGGSGLCEHLHLPSPSPFKPNIVTCFLRASTHIGSPVASNFLACWEWHYSHGWIPDFSSVEFHLLWCFTMCDSVTRKLPVSWVGIVSTLGLD